MLKQKNNAQIKCNLFKYVRILLYSLLVSCASDSTLHKPSYNETDTNSAIERRVQEILDNLSIEEKVHQMSGLEIIPNKGLWFTPEIERFGIPGYRMTDGPRGLTANKSLYGEAGLSTTTCFPVGMARGASFDVELEQRIGQAIGLEVRAWGGNVVLAPVVNVLRHPGWGRAQETYGEDPYHIGRMGVAFINGAQENVIASLKHFALNSIEDTRLEVDVSINERALREIYLPHFRMAVTEANVGSVMTAYNSVNGQFCSENEELLSDILKKEWNFQGFVISDWIWGTHSTVAAATAGLDIEMPNINYFGNNLIEAIENGELAEKTIDEAVRRIIRKQLEFGLDQRSYEPNPSLVDEESHAALALEAALKSLVLLKNENATLPIAREKVTSLVLVGSFSDIGRLGDNGSSSVNPDYVVTPLDGFRNRSGSVAVGSIPRDKLTEEDEIDIAAADAAIVFVGFTHKEEGERIDIFSTGGDRKQLSLSPEHEGLIQAVARNSKRTIVIVEAGSAVIMESWINDVEAVIFAWYPGQEGGNAIADVAFGDFNPSGRLPLTIPRSLDQLPEFDTVSTSVDYDYFHGYRLLEKSGQTPRFPFGHGLSYTNFEYSPLTLSSDAMTTRGNITVSMDITNRGNRFGSEVVQLYVSYKGSRVERPEKELKGFTRVGLKPGETQTVSLEVSAEDLAYYDETSGSWKVEPITYTVHLGASIDDIRDTAMLQIFDENQDN